jgi:ribonuclease Y
LEQELSGRRRDVQREESRLDQRRGETEKRADKVEKRENELGKRQSAFDKQARELEQQQQQQLLEVERVAGLTAREAKEELIAAVEKESRDDMARVIRRIEEEAKIESENRARKLLVVAMQRVASEQVSEHSISTVPIPSDDIKGRIIGRNGRNIRAFEQAAGVDVMVDDTPEAVMVASFDPVRREVARRALTKLILDGRIHPTQIEKTVEKSKKEVEVIIKEEGERAAYDAGVPGLRPEILRLVGKLKFRTSYGQDQHAHAVESARLAGVIAAEIGANVEVAKAGGLLHDLGKAVDHEVEGTHAAIGAEICRRYGVSPVVCNAVAAHHQEVDQECLEATIVEVADAISGARPGARRENLEQYVKRIRALEEIACSTEGVGEAFALQAGREVRVIVSPEKVDDLAALQIARDVARKVEETLQYPGQIKVTVIRETRAVDFAK